MPIPQAKNIKTSWEEGEGTEASIGLAVRATISLAQLCLAAAKVAFSLFSQELPLASYGTFLPSRWSSPVLSSFLPPESTLCFL